MRSDVYSDLKERGLIFQESESKEIPESLKTSAVSVYAGFDPTADSLHVGNLIPLIALARFQKAGHHAIAVVGGGTGLIGDPSGKASERKLNDEEIVESWTERIRGQIGRFLDFSAEGNPARLLNNYEWISPLSAISLLRDVGKHFSVNSMLAKESVKARIVDAESGISFTEFAYMILQAYDFLYLAQNHNCSFQIGGSDQWGNITAGIELVRRKLSRTVYGITFPLITTASGAKFGKTEVGTVWLDPRKTSPFSFYQYWVNVDDRDVVRFFKLFTFCTVEEIGGLEREFSRAPEQRALQKRLAMEMTRMVHGQEGCRRVVEASEALFGERDLGSVDTMTLEMALEHAPTIKYKSIGEIPPLPQLLTDVGLCESKSLARKTIESGGIYVNNVRTKDHKIALHENDFVHGRFLILRRGKKSYTVVRLGN